MALEDTELLAEIEEIGRLSEEINQSLTEVQWRQQLDAPASTTEQTENGAEMGVGQYPPTHPDHERSQQTQTVMQNPMVPTITVTNAVPREYLYPDFSGRQQNILTRSTPVYRSPIAAAVTQMNPTPQTIGMSNAGIARPQIHQFPQTVGPSFSAIT